MDMINKKVMLGSVIVLGIGSLIGCHRNTPEEVDNTELSHVNEKSSSSNSYNTSSFNDLEVSVEEAIALYQEQYPDSDLIKINLEESRGQIYYEMEGVDDEKEYELKINAQTKKIDQVRSEKLESSERNGTKRANEKLNLENLLSISEIIDRAIEEYPDGTISGLELDRELNSTYWELEIDHNLLSSNSLKIDAQTGVILETERD